VNHEERFVVEAGLRVEEGPADPGELQGNAARRMTLTPADLHLLE
jgi:hypothetical protein